MQLFVFDSYEALSAHAAKELAQCMQSQKAPLLCTASGDSPAGLYKQLLNFVVRKELDISTWNFVGLDEWIGLNGKDEGSCRYHLNQAFFTPLQIPEERIFFFDGRTPDPYGECMQAESFIKQHGGMTATILGLGLNGHVGMNEPNTSSNSRSHVSVLDPLTTQTGQKYFTKTQVLSEGITLGLRTIYESENIFLIVSGLKKASIVKSLMEATPSEKIPASLLLQHKGLRIFLDYEAASLLDDFKR